MKNLILQHREELSKSHYITQADIRSHNWFNFYSKKLGKYRRRMSGVCLVVVCSPDEASDFYCLPLDKFSDQFSEDRLVADSQGKMARWVGTIRDHKLAITGSPDLLDVSEYYGNSQPLGLLKGNSKGTVEAGEIEYPDEIANPEIFFEGAIKRVSVNRYERNQLARKRCLDHHGLCCCACGFDFAKFYGERGMGFIHVHHLLSLAEIGGEYILDPVKDLRPVCPNCHAMIHRGPSDLSIEELRNILGRH